MIAFSVLMLVMGTLICFTSYWISWEIQDTKTRPAFGAKLKSDWTGLVVRFGSSQASGSLSAPSPRRFHA